MTNCVHVFIVLFLMSRFVKAVPPKSSYHLASATLNTPHFTYNMKIAMKRAENHDGRESTARGDLLDNDGNPGGFYVFHAGRHHALHADGPRRNRLGGAGGVGIGAGRRRSPGPANGADTPAANMAAGVGA